MQMRPQVIPISFGDLINTYKRIFAMFFYS